MDAEDVQDNRDSGDSAYRWFWRENFNMDEDDVQDDFDSSGSAFSWL